jgi:hypothetical protein
MPHTRAHPVIHDLTVCADCTQVIANDDTSGLDNLAPEHATTRRAQIRAGITTWNDAGYYLVPGNPAGYETTPCDCCDSPEHGTRDTATAIEA